MNVLMGHNMMRKDGEAHMQERKQYYPAVSVRAVREVWQAQFEAHARAILDAIATGGFSAELVSSNMPCRCRQNR